MTFVLAGKKGCARILIINQSRVVVKINTGGVIRNETVKEDARSWELEGKAQPRTGKNYFS